MPSSSGSSLFNAQSPALPSHVKPNGGMSGEVFDLRRDLKKVLNAIAPIGVAEFTNPAAAGAADLEAAAATTVLARTVTTFLGPGVAKLADCPRNISFTTAGTTPASAPATATITGTYMGKAQTEVVNVSQTAATVQGTKPFSKLTSVVYSVAEGTDATVAIGVGTGLGVGFIPLSRAGGVLPVREIANGAVPTAGVLTATGLYTPNAAANGTNDYAVYYELSAEASKL